MQDYFPTVLVIGAGQLARMMIEASTRLGIKIRLLAAGNDESAAQISSDNYLGDYRNLEHLINASMGVSVVTFDHEHVPLELLAQLEKMKIAIRPGIKALACSQDKAHMRQTLHQAQLPNP
ncbi:MAG: 5-(carboxyamino)imidazole ribonucleotide synthase, partial [Candidatus Nanopelagicales bacterium]